MKNIFEPLGMTIILADFDDTDHLTATLASQDVALVWIESPSNPLLKIVDIQKITQLTQRTSTKVVVDNTFATPYFQQPLQLGADIIIHSATKYLGGHSDIVAGATIVNDEVIKQKFDYYFLN